MKPNVDSHSVHVTRLAEASGVSPEDTEKVLKSLGLQHLLTKVAEHGVNQDVRLRVMAVHHSMVFM